MTDGLPPLRDLPPGRLEARRRHLLAEIGSRPARRRWERPALAAALAAGAAASLAYALVPSSGRVAAPKHRVFTAAYSMHAKFPIPSVVFDGYFPTGDTTALTRPAHGLPFDYVRRGPAAIFILAQRLASANGDPHPTREVWVRTTRQRAVSSQSRDHVDGPRRAVWFVVLNGRFVDRHAYFLGRRAPRGTVLSFTIDVKRGIVLDLALGRTRPDYSVTGKPHAFRLGRSAR